MTEIASYFSDLSNWGRWGFEDEAGTLNLITDEVTKRAASLITEGHTVGCSRPMSPRLVGGNAHNQCVHLMIGSGEAAEASGPSTAGDWFGVGCHGFDVTHLDAHSHIFWDGQMYNGRSADLCTSDRGAIAGGLEPMFDGIMTRAILVDGPGIRGKEWMEPGEGLRPEELDAWLTGLGLEPRAGDIMLVRTGRDAWESAGQADDLSPLRCPGLDATCLPWLHEHGVALLGGDCTNDAMPSGHEDAVQWAGPIHAVGLVSMGLWLIDNVALGSLSAACQRFQRWEFALTLAPTTLRRATGSPVTPVAVF